MEVKDLLSLLWRNVWILVAGLVIGAGLGVVAARVQTPVYEAETQVLISRARQQTNTDMLPLGEDQLLSTNVQMAKSQPVLDAVSDRLGSQVESDAIQVTTVPNTLIMQIRAQDTDPRRAAQMANVLVDVLIQQNGELVSARYADFESKLNDQIDQLQQQIEELQSQIDQINEESISEQLRQVSREIERLQSEIAALEQEINDYPAVLNDKQRTEQGLKQARLEQLRSNLDLYQQIQTNLTFIGKPGQTGVSRDDPRLNSLQSTLDLYQQLYLGLVDSRETINLDRMQNTPNIMQIDPALPPEKPIRPLPLLYVLLATVVGLALSTVTVLIMDHFDDTLKSPQKVKEMLGVPIIGKISESHRSLLGKADSTFAGPNDPAFMNAFGSLRINVHRMMLQHSVTSLLITSPARGDGKTTVALNLASAFARSGRRVVLIDADLYHPQLHVRLKLDNQVGLTSILADGLRWEEVKQDAGRLTLITGGPRVSSSGVLLESGAMIELMIDLQQDFDVVIVDGPPLFLMDAQILASLVGGIVMVIRQGDTLTAVARAMLDQLNLMEVNVFGVVLNCVPQKQSSYYFDERVENLGKKPSKALDGLGARRKPKGDPQEEAARLDETGTSLR